MDLSLKDFKGKKIFKQYITFTMNIKSTFFVLHEFKIDIFIDKFAFENHDTHYKHVSRLM